MYIAHPCFQSNLIQLKSRQRQEVCDHLRIIRRPQPRNWVPTLDRPKALRSTPRVTPRDNVVQHTRVRIQCGVDKAHRAFPDVHSCGINKRHDGTKSRRRSAAAEDILENSINGYHVVNPISRDIREAAGLFGGVIAVRAIGWPMMGIVGLQGGGLIGRSREDVRKAAAGVDGNFGCLLRPGDCGIDLDLRSTHSSYVWACGRKARVKPAAGTCII
jgi:hypothetical protein